MSFIGETKGTEYKAGAFLTDDENCVRETRTIPQEGATTADNGGKYHKAGEVYPAQGDNAEGLLYEDVDVTNGDMPGSVVTKGHVTLSLLPQELTASTLDALSVKGFLFTSKLPTVTRPY